MSILARVAPVSSTRPCEFCLALQDDSVFADFDVDQNGCVYLCRISFDGIGCRHVEGSAKMSIDDSRFLIAAVARDDVQESATEDVLRAYFRRNSDVICRDGLIEHDLL